MCMMWFDLSWFLSGLVVFLPVRASVGVVAQPLSTLPCVCSGVLSVYPCCGHASVS